MGVDQTSLDRIRNATFPSSRRGYDKHEVEKFLARLADWLETGGGDESRSDDRQAELERVGQRTGAILAQAEESAQQIRAEAEEEARGRRSQRRTLAPTPRTRGGCLLAGDALSAEPTPSRRAERSQGGRSDRATPSGGGSRRSQTQRPRRGGSSRRATQRREDIEAVIADLVRRRDDVLADTEELSAKLTDAVARTPPGRSSTSQFDKPEEPDPVASEHGGDRDRAFGREPGSPERHRGSAGARSDTEEHVRPRGRGRNRRSLAPSTKRARRASEVTVSDVRAALDAALEGGPERHRKKVAEQEKLPVRERVARLLDPGTRSPRRACSPTGSRRGWAPTASSPGWGRSAGARSR